MQAAGPCPQTQLRYPRYSQPSFSHPHPQRSSAVRVVPTSGLRPVDCLSEYRGAWSRAREPPVSSPVQEAASRTNHGAPGGAAVRRRFRSAITPVYCCCEASPRPRSTRSPGVFDLETVRSPGIIRYFRYPQILVHVRRHHLGRGTPPAFSYLSMLRAGAAIRVPAISESADAFILARRRVGIMLSSPGFGR